MKGMEETVAMDQINITVTQSDDYPDISIIKVNGYVDTTTSAELEENLKRVLRQGMFRVVIDLGGVNYISSAGWGIFISEIKNIRENNGDLKLTGMMPDVYEVFELLEFQTILESYDSIEDALSSFGETSGSGGGQGDSGGTEEPTEKEPTADAKLDSA
jgi:anti-sigma B factor antagonist